MEYKRSVGLTLDYFNGDLFKKILHKIDSNAILSSWSPFQLDAANISIISTMQSECKVIGLVPFHLEYTLPNSADIHCKNIVFKSKQRGYETISSIKQFGNCFNKEKQELWGKYCCQFGIDKTDYVELMSITLEGLQPVLPEIYWSLLDAEHDIFVFAMEYFSPEKFTHLNTINDTSLWSEGDVTKVLCGMAKMHAQNYELRRNVDHEIFKFLNDRSGFFMLENFYICQQLVPEVLEASPELFTQKSSFVIRKVLSNMQHIANMLINCPKTLIHCDFSTRNLCLRRDPEMGKEALCLYDWDAPCIGPPQLDLAHFLAEVLPENTAPEVWKHWIEVYVSQLTSQLEETNTSSVHLPIDFDQFVQVFHMCVIELLIYQYVTMAGTVHNTLKLDFLKRCLNVICFYVDNFSTEYSFLRN